MKSIKDRILIVENNPEISDFLANQALVSTDYQVFQVADASSAINKAVQINPDLIISNLNLPGLSGKDLLIALSSHGITPPTIMLATAGHEEDIIQAFRLGAADYITWPIRDTEVVLVVERLLKQVHDRRDHINLENRLQITNQQLQQRVKELTAIFSIGKAVTSITNHKILFDKILQISAQVSQSDLGWFLMRQEEKGKNFLLVSQYKLPDIFLSKMHKVWDDGISQLVAISGETLSISGEPIKRFKVKVLGESIIIVPVKIQRQVMGLLVLMRKLPNPFSQSEQRLLEAVTDYASISFVNARLFRSYEAREKALSSLVHRSQINEQIANEIFFKTKNNLDDLLSIGQESWDQLQRSFDTNEQEVLKKNLESFEKCLHEIQNLSSLLHTASYSGNANQNQMFDLVSIVNDLCEQFQPIVQSHQLSIRKETLINSLNISANPNHVYESIKGILTNAIQFCEEDGEIFITINQDISSNAILSISNTGKIPEQTKKQFLSAQNHYEKQDKIRFGGIGISLNLVQKIISHYSGRIWVEDNPEYGATFHLSLPITE
jgi:DNA-binding response OmpR family regulator